MGCVRPPDEIRVCMTIFAFLLRKIQRVIFQMPLLLSFCVRGEEGWTP